MAGRATWPNRLPGPMVGSRFEPHPRPWRHYDVAPPDARPAAVLLLLYPHEGPVAPAADVAAVAHLAAHAGQVSLPGGAVEPGETTAEAALREFHEELGDDGQPIDLLGTLSPLYVQASNYLVTPWVAAVRRAAAVRRPTRRKSKKCWKCRWRTCSTRPISAATLGSTRAAVTSPRTSSSRSHQVLGRDVHDLGGTGDAVGGDVECMRVVVFDMDGLMFNTEDVVHLGRAPSCCGGEGTSSPRN